MTRSLTFKVMRYSAMFLMASTVLAGCGVSPSAAPITSMTTSASEIKAPIDVCGVFSADEIAQYLGKGFEGKNDSEGTDFACTYHSSGEKNTFTITARYISGSEDAENW